MSNPLATGFLVDPAPSTGQAGEQPLAARTLSGLAQSVPEIQGVWKRDTRRGDWILVRTRNSQYVLAVQDDETFVVSGGWFDRTSGESGGTVRVTGCTWGGSAILTGLVAAPGMFVEFSNGVRTTRVRDVRLVFGGNGRPH